MRSVASQGFFKTRFSGSALSFSGADRGRATPFPVARTWEAPVRDAWDTFGVFLAAADAARF